MVNIRTKGANAEREMIGKLNATIQKVLDNNEWPVGYREIALKCIQRNQNQSAVGGNDLSNVFGLSIEIKRQENLQINTWWEQCLVAARRNDEQPVLLYRQSHCAWECYTMGSVPLPGGLFSSHRVHINADSFFVWFYQWVYYKMRSGDLPKI